MKRCIGQIKRNVLVLVSLAWGTDASAVAPPNGGTVAIELQAPDAMSAPLLHLFVEAVSQALTARGFTIFNDTSHAAYLAEVTVNQAVVGTGLGKCSDRDPVMPAGAGVVIPLSTGNSSLIGLQRTQLELRIRHREDGIIVWDGSAVTVRGDGTQMGIDQSVASDLSQALLAGYPAEPKGGIGVP